MRIAWVISFLRDALKTSRGLCKDSLMLIIAEQLRTPSASHLVLESIGNSYRNSCSDGSRNYIKIESVGVRRSDFLYITRWGPCLAIEVTVIQVQCIIMD